MAADGTRFAVTGHRSIADAARLRQSAIALLATMHPPLTCVSSLAAGADQIVARAALEAGAELHVVIPAQGYERTLPPPARREFERLCRSAASALTLPYSRPGPAAYAAAGRRILEDAELLIAVWDGGPSRGPGGTADVIRMARLSGIPVHILSAARGEV